MSVANVLNRQFNPAGPNLAYVSDISYIRAGAGWLYLAIVLDRYARKGIGWAMVPDMPTKLVCGALSMAIGQRQPAPGLIVHSVRGSPICQRAVPGDADAARCHLQYEPQGQLLG